MKMINGSTKQDRLAEALRANLRRRKTPKNEPGKKDDGSQSSPDKTQSTK
jgi:hypothetical protein